MTDLVPLNDTSTNTTNETNNDIEVNEVVPVTNNETATNKTFVKQPMLRLFLILISIIGVVALVIILITNSTNKANETNVTSVTPTVNNSVTTTTSTGLDDVRNRTKDNGGTAMDDTEEKETIMTSGKNSTTDGASNAQNDTSKDLNTTTNNNSTNTTTQKAVKLLTSNEKYQRYIPYNCILGNTVSMSSNSIVYGEKDAKSTNIKLYSIEKNETETITTLNETNYLVFLDMETDMSTIAISSNGTTIAFVLYKEDKTYIRIMQYNEDTMVWDTIGNDILYNQLVDNEILLEIQTSTSNDEEYIALGVGYTKDSSVGIHSGKSSVYIYDYNDDDWTLVEDLLGQESGDKLGTDISLTVQDSSIIFATSASSASKEDIVGAVYIHRYNVIIMNDHTITEIRSKNIIYGSFANANFGSSISLSSDGYRLAVGAELYSFNEDLVHNGLCNVYEYTSSNEKWNQVGKSIMGEYNHSLLGDDVVLSGDGHRIAITHKRSISDVLYTDFVKLYEFSGGNWGASVAVDGDFYGYYENEDSIGYGENVGLSEDGGLLVISSVGGGGGDDEECGLIFLYDVGSTS